VNDTSEQQSGVAAVERALAILGAFSERDDGLTLAQLAERTGFYKSTILRLLQSLQRHGYARRLPDGRYFLGPALLRLGGFYQRNLRLGDYVVPALKALAAQCGESVSFSIREGDGRVCLHRVDSEHAIRDHVCEGDMLPLERGAGGKVLLAFSGAQGAVFDRIRERMVVSARGERDPELGGVASPVFGDGQALVGALMVSGPLSRLDARRMAQLEPMVLRAAAALTQTLGGDASAFSRRVPRKAA
jgi:DNA-binding IclR family transcriptional regulator